MNFHDYLNIRRVYRTLASEFHCPVWALKLMLRRMINRSWEKAMTAPEEKARWDSCFPDGKPTPDQYVLMLGHAYEKGEEAPFLLKE